MQYRRRPPSLRQPIVTMAGNRFYNNSTAYLLNKMDLGELVASLQEYIDLSVRMIDNPITSTHDPPENCRSC